MKKIIAFDCDSTLSSIEGIDELSRLSGNNIFSEIELLTNRAMNGEVPIEDIFERRLDLIKPTKEQCASVGQLYIKTVEPTAKNTISKLQAMGWECLIISGGFLPCIKPLAQHLGIEKIEAVPLHFDDDGNYDGYVKEYPTTRSGGKPEIIEIINKSMFPDIIIMVGDGVSDLETQPKVDHFIGFFRYIRREKVAKNCMHQLFSLAELPDFVESV